MPWYLYLALKQLFPTGRLCSFSALVSILGVTLGVMVLLVVQSVMNGFSSEIKQKVIEVGGHVRIESGRIIDDYQEVIELARGMPGVEAVEPYAHGVVMAVHRNRPAFPFIRGMQPPNGQSSVVPLESFVIMGSLDDLDDDSIALSSRLAAVMGASIDSTIEVYSPLMLERLKADEVLLPRELRVVAIFETGWNQVDANTMVCTLRLMQDLYGLDHGVHGIAIRLDHDDRSAEVATALNAMLKPPLHAYTWLASNHDLLFVLRLEKTMMFFIILFIVLVAAFSIASSLFTAVVRKTREIGVIGALGGRPWEIACSFCLQGLFIGIVGTVLGIAGAVLALTYRNEIVQTFTSWTKSETILLEYYQFANLPMEYAASDFVIIIVFSIAASTLAGVIPAWRATRLKPSDALRNEF